MKNVTITLREDVAAWLKVEAAKAGQSMSAYVSTVLEGQMGRGSKQLDALEAFLSGPGYAGLAVNLPKRDDLYDRAALLR